jgi:YihY family inner membrane protein
MNRIGRWTERLDAWQRTRAWIGFPVGVVKKFGDDRAGSLAALIAYYAFLSLFPLLLVFVTTVSLVARSNPAAHEALVTSALDQFPVVGSELGRNVHALSGSWWTVAVGTAVALWSGLAVVGATEEAMNQIWDQPRTSRPPFWRRKLRALVVLGVFAVGLVVTAACGTLATAAGSGVGSRLGSLLMAFLVAAGLFAATFRVLTTARLSWRDVLPGAAVGGVAWILIQSFGVWLVDRQVRGSSDLYGTFGLVLGLVAWLYLTAQITVLAAEINVVRARRLWPRSLAASSPPTPADRRSFARQATEERMREGERVDVAFDQREDEV